jgi:hypothetical protein
MAPPSSEYRTKEELFLGTAMQVLLTYSRDMIVQTPGVSVSDLRPNRHIKIARTHDRSP